MKEPKAKLKAIDFFCGAGGMTFGLLKAGIRVLAGIDIDLTCRETYEINNAGSKFIERDIHEFAEEELSELTGIKKDDDSLIFVGCSPCQYWTKINTPKKKSADTKNLLGEFRRFIDWYEPGYVVVENVPGLFNAKKERVLDEFLEFLEDKSYEYEHDIINANYYGVPQNRERYLLIATRFADSISLPEKIIGHRPVVRDIIGVNNGFPRIGDGHVDNSDFLHRTMALSEKNKKRIRKTPKNGGTRMSWKNDPELQIDAYRGKDHIFRNVYGRMFWDKPAPTITTKFHSLSNGRFGHPEEYRALSLREGATLQTFPKTYVFRGTNIFSIARHIGNAVPPELAKRIGQTILRSWENASLSS